MSEKEPTVQDVEEQVTFWTASAPEGYADFDETDEGEWKPLIEDGKEVALVWTNWNDGVGIRWSVSTPLVKSIFKKLIVMKKMGESAGAAYSLLDRIEGTEFGEPTQGPLSGANADFDEMVKSRG